MKVWLLLLLGVSFTFGGMVAESFEIITEPPFFALFGLVIGVLIGAILTKGDTE